jgi:glucose/arabinose dehydrogenase
VIEVDEQGRRTLELNGLPNPWAVQGLPDGRRFVLCTQAATIVEFDMDGAEVRRIALPDGFAAAFRCLDNGNLIVAMNERGAILEVKPDGSVVAETRVPGRPFDVEPLDNGRFLVCVVFEPNRETQRVIEVDRDGRILWSLDGFKYPASAQRLDNGHTLVADARQGRVAEFDREGRLVWERTGLQQCYSAQRLPDGGTLLSDRSGVREITADGKERWLLRANWSGRIARY